MQLPREYPFAVAVALAMNMQCYAQSWKVGGERKKIFNKQFMQKQFGLKHRADIAEQIQPGGYPDTGNGLYAQKLSYKDWYRFNVQQRIHLNYVENISFATTAILAVGIYSPGAAVLSGLSIMIGRMLNSTFYHKQGGAMNKLRQLGALLGLIGLVGASLKFYFSFYQKFIK